MADVINLDDRRDKSRRLTYFPGNDRPEVMLARHSGSLVTVVAVVGVDAGGEGLALTPDQADELADQLRTAARAAREPSDE